MPVYESDVIIFYQLNCVVLGTFLTGELEADMNRTGPRTPGGVRAGPQCRYRG